MKPALRGLLLAASALLMLTACATMGPPRPPSLDLPKPPSDLKGTRKGGKVTLTWTIPTVTTDRQAAHSFGPTRICRGLEPKLEQCGKPVGEVNHETNAPKPAGQKAAASFTDFLPPQLESDNPTASVVYAIEVSNADGRSAGLSNQVRVPLIRTLSPPKDFSARVTGQGVVLTWTGEIPLASDFTPHYLYRVYRRLESSQQQALAGEAPLGTETSFSLTDASIEWQKTYEYRIETVTVITSEGKPAVQVEGDDSAAVKVFANDVFPPAVPSGLQAVFSGPGQQPFIDLIWSPVTDVDLDGYNVYRHEEGGSPVKVNSQLVKTPAYRDANVATGKNYFYSVSAVDVRGNESARSEEASERVP
jgi:hypothetical protein